MGLYLVPGCKAMRKQLQLSPRPIRAILALRAMRGSRFVSCGLSLVMVGVTSLVGVVDRIFLLPRPLMRLRPQQSVTGRASFRAARR